MNRSSRPPSTKTSASPTVPTVSPTAPAATWRRADLDALVGLGMRPERDATCGHRLGHARRSRCQRDRGRRSAPAYRSSLGQPEKASVGRTGSDPAACQEPRFDAAVIRGKIPRQEGAADAMTISQPRGLALETIAEVDPDLWAGDAGRATPPARQHRADRQRELRLCRGHGGPGQLADQQVRRGPARQALLRRLRVRRRRRDAGPGARARAVSRAPSTSTSSRTRAPRPTWPPTSASSSPATGSWA